MALPGAAHGSPTTIVRVRFAREWFQPGVIVMCASGSKHIAHRGVDIVYRHDAEQNIWLGQFDLPPLNGAQARTVPGPRAEPGLRHITSSSEGTLLELARKVIDQYLGATTSAAEEPARK